MTTATKNETTFHLYGALGEYERWRLVDADYSTKTWAGEKSGLLGFVDFMADRDEPILWTDQLDYDAVREWFADLTVGESTRPTRLAQLRAFLGYCIKRGWLAQDPSLLLRAQRPAPVLRDRLDAQELLSLIEAGRTRRDRVLIALAANLALRGGEIAALRVGLVDLARHELRVGVSKTRDSDVMPLSSDLAVELSHWLRHYTEACAVTPRSFLVPSQYVDTLGDRVLYRPDRPVGKPYAVVQDALKRIGWGDTKGEGVHTVRRSVARIYFEMIEADETFDSALLATMTLLHHQRSDTTLRYIGRDRATLARDRVLKGKPFLSRYAAECAPLRLVTKGE